MGKCYVIGCKNKATKLIESYPHDLEVCKQHYEQFKEKVLSGTK